MSKKKSSVDREIENAMNADIELLEDFCEWAYTVVKIQAVCDEDHRPYFASDLHAVADAIGRLL